MDGTLVESLPTAEPADVYELVRQLCREVFDLRQQVDELRRENAELRQQAGYWKGMHSRAVQRAERLEAEVEQLRGETRKLQDQLFGRTSEAASSHDRSNRLEGGDDPAPTTPPQRGQRKDRPGPTRRDYSHLPVVEELREWPEPQRVCPQCGAALSPSDTEDSEQIEIEAKYSVYLERQDADIASLRRDDGVGLPADIDYGSIDGLSNELREKLSAVRPATLGQAGRVGLGAFLLPDDRCARVLALVCVVANRTGGTGRPWKVDEDHSYTVLHKPTGVRSLSGAACRSGRSTILAGAVCYCTCAFLCRRCRLDFSQKSGSASH